MKIGSKILLGIGILLLSISLILFINNYLLDLNSTKNVLNTMDKYVNNYDIKVYDDFIVKVIDNEEFIGILEIPSLNLYLPITYGYSNKSLKNSPGLYYGSLNKNLVICGHSYRGHFGYLNKLKTKDKIYFRDVYNNVYKFEVVLTEELLPNEVKEMIESDFDLTLYTCTKDGKRRLTIRCNRI